MHAVFLNTFVCVVGESMRIPELGCGTVLSSDNDIRPSPRSAEPIGGQELVI